MQSLIQSTPKYISIAPMMGWTNPSMQKIVNVIAPNMVFYSEMYHVEAVIRKPDKLTYSSKNLVLQLGGSCPEKFFQAGKILKNIGINKININVGCPSNKVQKGNFGACLMREPKVVSECLNALSESFKSNQLSVKCRLGVDNDDSESFLQTFISCVHKHTNVKHFIIHARKAWLSGLNPKQNRDIPPLHYDRVHKIKAENKKLHIGINGGINNLETILAHMKICDEVMVGRLLLNDLYGVHIIDASFNKYAPLTRCELIEKISDYDTNINRFLQSLYKGKPGCKRWRQDLANIRNHVSLIELSKKTRLFAAQEIR